MIAAQTVHTDIIDRNPTRNPIRNLILNPNLLIKKILAVVRESNMDAVKTVQQQGLVRREWFQFLIVALQAVLNRLLRRHNLV
jgi:hypothetical protein